MDFTIKVVGMIVLGVVLVVSIIVGGISYSWVVERTAINQGLQQCQVMGHSSWLWQKECQIGQKP